MIKTVVVSCIKRFIDLGGANFVPSWCHPIIYQYMKIVLSLGSPALMKEYMTIGTRLLIIFFEANQDRLALDMSTVGIRILQKSVKRKSGKRRHELTLEVISKTFVRGLDSALQKGYKDHVNALMDDRTRLLADAIQNNDRENASNLSEVGMVLLMAAIEDAAIKRIHRSTTDYLLKYWVGSLDSAATVRQPLVQTLINARASDINEFAKRGNFTYGTLLTAMMKVVQVAIRERRGNVLKMLSKSTVEALDKAIKDCHREIVDSVLCEGTAAISHAIKEGKETEARILSEVGQEMLIAAIEGNANQLAGIMSEFWLTELDQAARDGYSEAVYSLIDARAMTLYEAMRNDITEANSVWKAGIETLLAAIRLKREALVMRISTSFVTALADVKAKFDEEFMSSLVNVSITEFTEAINSGQNDRANMLTIAAMEILAAAINSEEFLLVKDLSYAWIAGLDMGAIANQGIVDSLVEARMVMFNKALATGNEKKARVLSALGVELILAAVRAGNTAATQTIAKSLMKGLADAIDGGHKQTVDSLMNAQMEVFRGVASIGDLHEAEARSVAAIEIFLSAINEGKMGLVENLSRTWVEALSTAVKEDRDMAGNLMKKIRQRFEMAIAAADEIKALSIAAHNILQAANDMRNPAVTRLIETWVPLLE